jgi:hypothetical protein
MSIEATARDRQESAATARQYQARRRLDVKKAIHKV